MEKTTHEKSNTLFVILIVLIIAYMLGGGYSGPSMKTEPTKAVSSEYNKDIRKATTSNNLSKADIAWQATNTYGWDCEEVISKSGMNTDGYYYVECANGTRLRVYPRDGQHPRLTNANGTYK